MATNGNLFGRDDQVTVINPSNRDFQFSWNSKNYRVKAGKIARIPGYMAEHFVKELTNAMMIAGGKEKHLMDDNQRRPYYDSMIQDVVSIASFEDAQDNPGDITELGEETVAKAEARQIAQSQGSGKTKSSKRDKIETLPDPAIDTPIDIDRDLPPEDEMEEIARKSAAARGDKLPDDDTPASDLADDDAFPDAAK